MPRYRLAIKELFQAKGYKTAYAVARALNRQDTQAARIIDPKRARIDVALVNELCEFLKCKPGDLFTLIDDESASKPKPKKR